MKMRYLTKSRFKMAMDCVTQLYYTGKKELYADKNINDDFLLALAKGGYQVGELAKYYFCDDPKNELITIDALDYEEAVLLTNEALLRPGRVVISEAAFKYRNLFVRVDLLVRDNDVISIYEVKAKSIDSTVEFLNGKANAVSSDWVEYLYDIAFQRFVVRNALSELKYQLRTNLLLVNKDATTDIDGLHQFFKVYSDNNKIKVVTKDGIVRGDLGAQILIPISTDEVCDKIEYEFSVPNDMYENISFEDFIWTMANVYENDNRLISTVGSKCKNCRFYKDANDSDILLSGREECWKTVTSCSEIKWPMSIELWNGMAGSRSFADELALKNKHYFPEIEEADIAPKGKSKLILSGLTPHDRRMEQINRSISKTSESYFDAEGLRAEMESWVFPLHFIDFETSAVAIPFFRGLRPYEGVAFQFSHHIIDKDWSVRHETQYLSFDPGSFPNFEFVRKLKEALSKDEGSIFRYHNHENSYLNMIYRQLQRREDAPADKGELKDFILEITHDKASEHTGSRDMIDLYKLVLKYYYSPRAKGSNSLKQILPAIIADSEHLRSKYGRPGVYGSGKKVHSLNFTDHVWIQPEFGNNPYKTLPRVFAQYDSETLDLLVKDMEGLADGGAAMTAYNYLQFSDIPVEQRKSISDALLRYCELDTLAMVMLVEGWKGMIK
jgi:hypothetical protein